MAYFQIGGSVSENRPLDSGYVFSDPRIITRIVEVDESIFYLDRNTKRRPSVGVVVARKAKTLPNVLCQNGKSCEPLSLQSHSEYTSTFKWHEFGGYGHQDAAKHQPMSSNGKNNHLNIFID